MIQRMRENAENGVCICYSLLLRVLITSTQLNRLIVHNSTIACDDSSIRLINGLLEGMFDFVTYTEGSLIAGLYSA